MQKKSSLVFWILLGFLLGTMGGVFLSEHAKPETIEFVVRMAQPFGNVLVSMLKMAVYPIILFSLIVGAASLPLKKSGKLGGCVLIWYTATSLFATIFGVALATFMNPTFYTFKGSVEDGGNMDAANAMAGNASGSTLGDFIASLFQNPFSALANGQFLPIIVYAILFGLGARFLLDNQNTSPEVKAAVEKVVTVCDGIQQVSFKLIDWVMLYFPIGVFALSLANFATNGTLLFGAYGKITLCVATGVLAMILIVYPLLLAICCRQNPYKLLFSLRNPIITAFVTRSSAATLPVSFQTMDNLGVSRTLSSFSLPLGATVNMDGVCVHLPVFVILAANFYGYHLTTLQLGALCLSIMFASVGAGGIPGGSIFLLFMVLEAMGLKPTEVTYIVGLAIGINPILDMFETCCNVTGDNVCTYIVGKWFKLIGTDAKKA